MYSLNSCFILVSTSMLTLAPPSPERIGDALTRWEAIRQPRDNQKLDAYAKTVQDLTSKGDVVVTARLMAITQNRSQPTDSRVRALRVACALADSDSAETIVDTLETRIAYRLTPREHESKEKALAEVLAELRVTDKFLAASANSLLDKLPDHRRIHSLAIEAYRSGPRLSATNPALKLILGCQVSQEIMDLKIVEILGRSHAPLPKALVDRISSAALVPLRELVRAHRTPGDFHYGAARALAHLGDEEIKGVFNAMLPAARDHSPNIEASLLNLIWRIEVQHPPADLLEYIAATDHSGYRENREWAVRRAVKLGIEPAAIRDAILAHERNARTTLERLDLPHLKVQGIELGILQASDLPDVGAPFRIIP